MLKIDKEICTGCHACELKCPKGCICLKKDSYGFIYPVIDDQSCVSCGICEQVCHVNKEDKSQLLLYKKIRKGYYGWNKKSELIKGSSSGGAFSSLVDAWLDDDGVVFGAAYTDDFFYVSHECYRKENYGPLRKSKYVFSDLKDAYRKTEEYLKNNKKVLFTGTPCQIGGLRAFLRKDYPTLLTMDFICHGTPSINFLQEHLKYISQGRAIKNVDFRSKEMGWRKYCLKVEMEDETYVKPFNEDYYMYSFMRNMTLRSCCYSCQYSDGNHVSDITVADFWEIKKYDPSYSSNEGVSLVIFNNEKRVKVLKGLENNMDLWELEEKDFSYVYKTHDTYNKNNREKTMEEISRKGFGKLSERHYKSRYYRKLKKVLNKIIGR